jgi:hypothetical protein
MPALNFLIDTLDDEVVADGNPSFTGGQVSNERANLLEPTQSSLLLNCDLTKLGKLTTRQGSVRLGSGAVGDGTMIQGICNFFTKDYNYLVAANNGKIWQWNGTTWVQIATGGVLDNDDIEVLKIGRINNATGYDVGSTVLTVDTFLGPVANGDKFVLYLRDKSFEYIVTAHTETGGNTTQITIDEPGLVDKAYDDDWLILKRLGGKINHTGGYSGGTTTVAIDGITGALDNADFFIIKGEEVLHDITAHSESGGNTTSLTFTPALQGAYVSSDTSVPIVFAKGIDKIFWSDGIGNIFSWDGQHTGNLANGNIYDLWDATIASENKPPVAPKSLVWFQNRLIASAIPTEPDAVYFSDFLDATRWDRNFQQVRIGGGESDPVTAMVGWNDLNLVVFKQNSVYIVNCDPSQNPNPDDSTALVGSFAIKLIAKGIGCVAPQSAVQIGGTGGDILFLSDSGVRSLRRTVAAQSQQEIGAPLSFEVQDVIDRISQGYIQRSTAVYRNNRYLLALPLDGATRPNYVLVYNIVTQCWSGTWTGWIPTCFDIQTPSGTPPSLCFGQSDGTVFQWLDNTGADEGLTATYQDQGTAIPTRILSRAFIFGDLFSPKTGFNCEFEFTESRADVVIQAILDRETQMGPVGSFSTLSSPLVHLPFTLPITLPSNVLLRKQLDIQRYGQFREFQFDISSAADKLSLRSIKLSGFSDSFQLQTSSDTPIMEAPTA